MKSTAHSTYFLAACVAWGACSGGTVDPGGQPIDPTKPGDTPVVMTTIDYEQALRTAAIKLTGNYPTLVEIQKVRDAADSDRPTAYQTIVDDYLSRPSFAAQLQNFFRDTFKMGGQDMRGGTSVNFDYAPTYAAMLVVKEQPFTNVLTASSGTCQTLDTSSGLFTAANCPNQSAVGVLTDAGVHAQFFSSMAFRRVRWVQETFLCRKFPAETTGTVEQHPGGTYASPWPYNSITGDKNTKNAKINFQDDKSIICANCHTTINHLAPLFSKFSTSGAMTSSIQVKVPIPGEPTATLGDWLPAGEVTSWRFNQPVSDLSALGATIVADPDFARCVANRVWNWALSRPDVIDDAAVLTDALSTQLVGQLTQNNWNVKQLIRTVYTSDTFVHY